MLFDHSSIGNLDNTPGRMTPTFNSCTRPPSDPPYHLTSAIRPPETSPKQSSLHPTPKEYRPSQYRPQTSTPNSSRACSLSCCLPPSRGMNSPPQS